MPTEGCPSLDVPYHASSMAMQDNDERRGKLDMATWQLGNLATWQLGNLARCRGWRWMPPGNLMVVPTGLRHQWICTPMHCNALRCTVLHWNALQCTEMYCTALECNAMKCTALKCTAMQWNVLKCNAIQCNPMHCTEMHLNALKWTEMQCNATLWWCPQDCSISEYAHCNALLSWSLYSPTIWLQGHALTSALLFPHILVVSHTYISDYMQCSILLWGSVLCCHI